MTHKIHKISVCVCTCVATIRAQLVMSTAVQTHAHNPSHTSFIMADCHHHGPIPNIAIDRVHHFHA